MLHLHKYNRVAGWQHTVKQCDLCLKVKLEPWYGFATEDIHESHRREWDELERLSFVHSRKDGFPEGPWQVIAQMNISNDGHRATYDSEYGG